MESQGEIVTSLCVGEPDFDPPQCVTDAVTQAATQGPDTKYTAVTGTLALRTAIAHDLSTRKQLHYNPNTDIIVGSGAKPCVYQALLALAGNNDIVLVPAPYWPSYPEQVRLTGATPVIIETSADTGYILTPSQLRTTLQQYPAHQVKVLILCHPSNPTGSVYTRQQLQELCDVLYDYPHISVVADEIYERLVYDNNDDNSELPQHTSVASIPHMMHRTITINGVSKSHAMTGYRIGYAAGPAHVIRAMTTIQSQLSSCPSSISQIGATAALTQTPDAWMDHVVSVMQTKRNYVLQRLSTIPGVTVQVPPTGAFYVLPDVSTYCRHGQSSSSSSSNDSYGYANDTELCMALLQEQKLAVVPGSAFGAPGTIRISYATDMETLTTAMNKLQDFFTQIQLHDENAPQQQ